MANSSTDNGKQNITFKYQQEGTARGFNKLLHGVLPRGIISGGELGVENNSTISINPLQMLIGDNDVTAHVSTNEDAIVSNVTPSNPYIIATFDWEDIVNSYVNFQAVNYDSITDNAIILGKCLFDGNTLNNKFDYTRKTWSSSHINNDFGISNNYHTSSPNFHVIPKETNANEFVLIVEKGKGIIGGKFVELVNDYNLTLQISSANSENYFAPIISTNCQRTDIVILGSDGVPKYIMGTQTNKSDTPILPICPSNALTLASLYFDGDTGGVHGLQLTNISGDYITNYYHTNYYGGCPTLGLKVGTELTHKHTLFL